LSKFSDIFKDSEYLRKLKIAFNWFLGHNRLSHIIYNPCTTGCFDGLEENSININQGAESILSYLIARMTVEKYLKVKPYQMQKQEYFKTFKKQGNRLIQKT
jgi:hypothetical protein